MHIREFQLSDFESLMSLWRSRGLPLGPLETREALEAKLRQDPDLFLVAEKNGIVLAAVCGTWDGRRGYVCNPAVDPLFERTGIGTQLLREVERRLRARGAREIVMHIPRQSVIAQEYFGEQGFTPVPDQLMMVKRLIA